VNGHQGAVNQVDNGYKFINQLIKMMDMRSQIEEKYAKMLEDFSAKQRKVFDKTYENEQTKRAVMEMLLEANCTAAIHRAARNSLNTVKTLINSIQTRKLALSKCKLRCNEFSLR